MPRLGGHDLVADPTRKVRSWLDDHQGHIPPPPGTFQATGGFHTQVVVGSSSRAGQGPAKQDLAQGDAHLPAA